MTVFFIILHLYRYSTVGNRKIRSGFRFYTLKTPGSDLTRKRVRGGQTHFGGRPTRNPGQTDPESESERHFYPDSRSV